MNRPRRRIRFYLGLSLLTGLALASSLRFFYDFVIKGRDLWGKDDMSTFAEELRDLEAALPSRGIVSYWNGQVVSFPGRDQAQNILSPRLLTMDLKREWLILDRRAAVLPAPPAIGESYRVHRDFGNGIFLLKRKQTE
jgi:hypothetical protein